MKNASQRPSEGNICMSVSLSTHNISCMDGIYNIACNQGVHKNVTNLYISGIWVVQLHFPEPHDIFPNNKFLKVPWNYIVDRGVKPYG